MNSSPSSSSSPAAAPINVCIVGYGMAGRDIHGYLVSLVPQLNLHAFVCRSPASQEQAKRENPGSIIYASLTDALADPKVQLVIIGTPSGDHEAQALQALAAGKDVVIDKPMALTLDACDRILEAARKSGRLLTVFQNRRWDGDLMTVQQLIKDDVLGRVRWIEMAYQKGFTSKAWKAESVETGGGRFYDLGVHLIDQLMTLFHDKTVSRVNCYMLFDNPQYPKVDSHAMCTVEFTDRTTAVLDTSSMNTIGKNRFYVVGDKATFVKEQIDDDPQEVAMLARNIDAGLELEQNYGKLRTAAKVDSRVPTLKGRWRNFYENLAAVLQARYQGNLDAQPLVTGASVRRTMAVLDAALRSVWEKKPIDVNIPPAAN